MSGDVNAVHEQVTVMFGTALTGYIRAYRKACARTGEAQTSADLALSFTHQDQATVRVLLATAIAQLAASTDATEAAVEALDALTGKESEDHHSEADSILRDAVHPDVRAAYWRIKVRADEHSPGWRYA